jgi:Uma2 family endonuclease
MAILRNWAQPSATHNGRLGPLTLEEYLKYDDGTETHYELANGVLSEMPTENPLNKTIAMFLVSYFLQLGIPYYRLAIGHQIEVISEQVTAREPDLLVHSEASATAILQDGRLLRLGQPTPALVIEVVSNSEGDALSRERDYVHKRTEYAARGIPEYWIIDPMAAVVWVLHRVGETYQEHRFVEHERIVSTSFGALELSAVQVLRAGL